MISKKGLDISLNFIIVAVLGLIALIVIALFFTGGIAKLFGTEKGIAELTLTPQIKNLARDQCNLYCTDQQESSYNNPSFSQELIAGGYTDCEDLLLKPFSDCIIQKSCQKEDPLSAADCVGVGTTEASCEGIPGCVWK